jgi:hypothetical protein
MKFDIDFFQNLWGNIKFDIEFFFQNLWGNMKFNIEFSPPPKAVGKHEVGINFFLKICGKT